jgi:glucose/arabinose dehydrogenase
MRRLLLACLAVVALAGASAAVAVARGDHASTLGIARIASGFQRPVYATTPRSEPGRLYVVEQAGVIRVLVKGKLRAQPFLDIRSRVGSDGNEQGLLGLAFDPAYATNRLFYVDYTDKSGDTRIVAFRSNGARAIVSSARQLLHIAQPYSNHNGGMVAFGPDRKLYVGMGDGGAGGDPGNRAQNPNDLLGKLLRVDTLGRAAPGIRALGLRNPWRFSFDRRTGDLYIGDVGQNAIEEIDYASAGSTDLLNFGWRVYEGRSVYEEGELGPGVLAPPIAQYTHDDGCTVVGGYVYRGKAVRSAAGRYFYGDYCSGIVWSLTVRDSNVSSPRREVFKVPELSSFGEDAAGELYLVSLGGSIYRLKG